VNGRRALERGGAHISTEFAPKSATGKFQAVKHRPGFRLKRLLDVAADRRPPLPGELHAGDPRAARVPPFISDDHPTAHRCPERAPSTSSNSSRNSISGRSSVSIQEAGHALSDLGMDELVVNVMNTPVEAIESESPVRVERYELARDSGGPGTRDFGGPGTRARCRSNHRLSSCRSLRALQTSSTKCFRTRSASHSSRHRPSCSSVGNPTSRHAAASSFLKTRASSHKSTRT
jgi:Hydantoinase B/oxoprolinase